jgi:hypothetical protein
MPALTVEDIAHAEANVKAVDSTKMAPTTVQRKQVVLSKASQIMLDIEARYTVGGFTPLPGFMDSGKGAKLWVREYTTRASWVLTIVGRRWHRVSRFHLHV